jgi:hypothetical protein
MGIVRLRRTRETLARQQLVQSRRSKSLTSHRERCMAQTLNAFVHTLKFEAEGILSIHRRPVAGTEFPTFEAGSHIDSSLALVGAQATFAAQRLS